LQEDVFVISDEIWTTAKTALQKEFHKSSKLELCHNIIKDFEAINPKRKYKSDLEVFIRESKLEDFFNENGETIFVSTIHKAKGKEFDNVFLMLENFNPSTDEAKRQLYVAMTRAKRNLTIHLNGSYLDDIMTENLERVEDQEIHSPPNQLAMHLTLKDVWLDYFITRQEIVSQLTSGDLLQTSGNECMNFNGQPILRFSRQFSDTIERMKQRGFHLEKAQVKFIIYWKKEDAAHEIKIILPVVYFDSKTQIINDKN